MLAILLDIRVRCILLLVFVPFGCVPFFAFLVFLAVVELFV